MSKYQFRIIYKLIPKETRKSPPPGGGNQLVHESRFPIISAKVP